VKCAEDSVRYSAGERAEDRCCRIRCHQRNQLEPSRQPQRALQCVAGNVSLAMFVKICGITNQVEAELAIAAGADALGFNFWAGSRRYLEPAKAADWIRDLPDTVVRVGVVVNPTESYATTIAAMDGIDLLQLHGAESPEFCLDLVEADILLWKAIPMTGRRIPPPNYQVERILLDTVSGGEFGGSGVPFPWSWARDLIIRESDLGIHSGWGLNARKRESGDCRISAVRRGRGERG
jgi:phosphoribosylanthranilate isomerase